MFDIGNDEIPVAEPDADENMEKMFSHTFDTNVPSKAVRLDSYFTEYIEFIYKTFEIMIDFTTEQSLDNMLKSQNTHHKNEEWQKYEEILSIKKLKLKYDHSRSARDKGKLSLFFYRRFPPKAAVEMLNSLKFLDNKYDQSENKSDSHFKDKFWITPLKSKCAEDIKPMTDIVLTIRVYKPNDKIQRRGGGFFRPIIRQEVEVLGSQALTKLRDIITCPNDYVKNWNYAKHSNTDNIPYAKEAYKSNFFYFGKTFYNDMRNASNIDLSEVIRTWRGDATSNVYFGSKTAKMEDTKFSSLEIQHGYPYVYQHQGSCEHVIVFASTRLISKSDELSSKCYPRYNTPFRETNINCFMCGIYPVAWLTKNVTRIPHDPGLFCAECFRSYNYDERGQRVEEFFAHPFFQDKPIHEIELDLYRAEHERKKKVHCIECPPRLFADKDHLGLTFDASDKSNKKSKSTCKVGTNSFTSAPSNVLSRILDKTIAGNILTPNDVSMPSTSTASKNYEEKFIPSEVGTITPFKVEITDASSSSEVSLSDYSETSSSDSEDLPKTSSNNSSKQANKLVKASLAKAMGYKQPVLKLPQLNKEIKNKSNRSHNRKFPRKKAEDDKVAETKKKEAETYKSFYANLERNINYIFPLKKHTEILSAASSGCINKKLQSRKISQSSSTKKLKKSKPRTSAMVTRTFSKESAAEQGNK